MNLLRHTAVASLSTLLFAAACSDDHSEGGGPVLYGR